MKMPPLGDDGLQDLIASPVIAKLATTDARGDIRITPITFRSQEDGTFLMATWANTAVARNVRANPRCSLLIDQENPPFYGVHYWGTATVLGEPDAESIARIIERYVGGPENAGGLAQEVLGRGETVFVTFRPERRVAWDLPPGLDAARY